MSVAGGTGRTLAVVVAYFPERDRFVALLGALLRQVDAVLVVDNSPSGHKGAESVAMASEAHGSRLRITRCGDNLGIAAALNIGISAAEAEGFTHVLLSDQDSLPSTEMVRELRRTLDELTASGYAVASVSPAYVDEVTGQRFGFQVLRAGRRLYSNVPAELADPWIEVLSAITSGTLVPMTSMARVGLMKEEYFIDDVDVEWCLRARSKGLGIYATARATLQHRLGDDSFRFWLFGWKDFNSYSPLRLYYRFRNFVHLCREPHVSYWWKLRASWYWLGNLYAYGLFAPGRGRNLRFILRGLVDGFRGRMGRFDGLG